jgi:hypothetical protein
MKKLLLSAFLGLAAVALTPALSQAGTFGLFYCGHCCCSQCNFCVRPYNAFTPVCCGNITCMGCMPFAPLPNYSGLGYDGAACPVGSDCSSIGGETIVGPIKTLPTLTPPGGTQTAQPPGTSPSAPSQSPIITPVPGTSMAPSASGAVQANYRTANVPAYNPYAYYAYYGSVPYYWSAK